MAIVSGFKFIDLFAGIGGLRTAFESIQGECVFASEINKFAIETYKANFPQNHHMSGDITQIPSVEIPNHDVLLAGFPCQPFSLAGVSKINSLGGKHGFEHETQGTLFFEIARILRDKRPSAFMLENVKNLKSHNKGKTFEVIMKTLTEDLGYNVYHKVIDAKHFVPQHRERIIIVGFKENVGFCWDDLTFPFKNPPTLKKILHGEQEYENPDGIYTQEDSTEVNWKYIISDHLWKYLQEYAAKHKARGNGFGFGLFSKNDTARTLSARYYKDGSEILIKTKKGNNPRRLTPRECARLMGFDDSFKIPVSDNQAYQQFGNSVAVPVFKEVARIMKPHIQEILTRDTAYQKAG